ncbi:DUF2637 domain-containing protein [Nocardiopsis ganjiahuensis]|uniref:DUF2637 domain-containing protein n=1 Tax=Nocardiopsis ganjiahuensis TaxID=239984 RepID=UPI0003474A83
MEPARCSRTATIAAVVSYSHMYELALRHGEPLWRRALFPLSVDGMIVGVSMTPLSDARHGRKGGVLPWALLIIGSAASSARRREAYADDEQGPVEATGAEFVNTQRGTASEVTEASGFQVVNDVGGLVSGKALSPFQARACEWALE